MPGRQRRRPPLRMHVTELAREPPSRERRRRILPLAGSALGRKRRRRPTTALEVPAWNRLSSPADNGFTYNRAMKITGVTAILLAGLAGASLLVAQSGSDA